MRVVVCYVCCCVWCARGGVWLSLVGVAVVACCGWLLYVVVCVCVLLIAVAAYAIALRVVCVRRDSLALCVFRL